MDAAAGVLILGSLFSFPCLYPLQQGLQEGIWGMGEEAHNPRRCCGLGCQGHVVAMWQDPGVLAPLLPGLRPSVAAPPPPSCLREGRSEQDPSPLSISWRPEQQLGPIF